MAIGCKWLDLLCRFLKKHGIGLRSAASPPLRSGLCVRERGLGVDVCDAGFEKTWERTPTKTTIMLDLRNVTHYGTVRDADEQGDVAVQVDQRVHLHRTLALAEASPGKHHQTQIDRRVEGIGAALEFRAERIVGVQHAGTRNENRREIGEDPPAGKLKWTVV